MGDIFFKEIHLEFLSVINYICPDIKLNVRSCPFLLIILVVDRHTGRIINLEYVGEGEITKTVLLVGKVSKNK